MIVIYLRRTIVPRLITCDKEKTLNTGSLVHVSLCLLVVYLYLAMGEGMFYSIRSDCEGA